VAELRDLVRGIRRPAGAGQAGPGDGPEDGRARCDAESGGDGPAGGEQAALPLPEIMAAAEREFAAAADGRDAGTMAGVILELETAIRQWEADTDEDQGPEQARALLRGLIGRLGQAAQAGLDDPRDRLRPAVEPLIALRNTLRGEGNFAAADAIRQALAAAALDLGDTPDGTRWQSAEPV
jgi:cysteinyl-tRNA synthetase